MEFNRDTSNLIATLRGLPQDRSTARARPAFTLGSLIEVLEERYELGHEKLTDVIAKNWKTIVGPQWAHQCCPQAIVDKVVLLIQVPNPILRQELRFQERQILTRIQKLDGGDVIRALNFRAG
jgi:predicted nucleic acid-binding Zn ribbon protein